MGIFGKLIGRVANAVDNARYDGKELKTLQKKLEQIEKDLAPKEKDGGKQDTRLMDAMKKMNDGMKMIADAKAEMNKIADEMLKTKK